MAKTLNQAARALGRKGGNVTKLKGSQYYKLISKLGVEARRKTKS